LTFMPACAVFMSLRCTCRAAAGLTDLIHQLGLEVGDVGIPEERVDPVVLGDALLDEVLDHCG